MQEVYRLTKQFPGDELYGLSAQMRRAAVSIPSNIAEGFMRQYLRERIQFLSVALGSCGEVDTQAEIAKRLAYLNTESHGQLIEQVDHVSRMIRNLVKSLKVRA